MDRWFIVILEILAVVGALEALWWGTERVRSLRLANELQVRDLQAPKRRHRKAKEVAP